MKTFSPGLSDSIASVVADPRPCPHCDSSSHIAGGLCVGCLLEAGLDPIDQSESEALTDLLAEINLPDQNWRLGNYEILEEIGRGGMGVIYRARQRHSRRIVAVKRVLSYHSDSRETLARFRREAQAAASLDHPNILPIYEVSESEDGLPFFSMKFAPGGTLQQVAPALRDEPRQCVALVAKVARAVQYAHSRGILHRDLKPGNILLDGRGEPLVSDFGLAKWLDTTSDLTRTLTIFGTPGYIAPEQASQSAVQLKPTADVYSLGAILFDLLAGRPPFLGAHALSVIRQASESPAPKLRTLSKLADRDLETICSRCLEREPKLRYPSAHNLAGDLESWLEGRPIVARPVLPPTKLWRWSRRNPVLAGSLCACLLFGATALLWQAQNRRLEATARQDQLASRSIAVLPFLNLDHTRADETLTAAFARTLQEELSQFGPVRVVPISRSEPWLAGTGGLQDIKEANSSVNARAVLTGSERIVNDKRRISIRMMNAATGEVLLTRVVDLSQGSSKKEEMTREVLPAIRSILNATDWSTISSTARDPGMRNQEAREFIVSGRQLMFRSTIEDYDRSIRCLERAIEIEPNSAIAHSYLCSTQVARFHFVPDAHLLDRAEKEAREALRLAPDLPESHRALAGVFLHQENFADALEEQLRAIEAGGPEERVASMMGTTLITLGQPGRALGWLELAKHWAALPGDYDALIGDCWTLLGDDQRAESAYRRSSDLRPEISEGWVGLCHLRLLQGDINTARSIWKENQARTAQDANVNNNSPKMLAQIEFLTRNYRDSQRLYRDLAGKEPTGGAGFYGAISYSSALGRLSYALGDQSTGQAVLEECLRKESSPRSRSPNPDTQYRIAAIESSLGETDLAIKYLKAAVAAGWIDYRSLRLDPRFDAIAADPTFQQIIKTLTSKVAELRRQVGLPFPMALNGENSSP
jgi:tetratricopeptide (TPR) repeat protein/TolB-like protein/tRNA A-37 threonylcarbamoyl transferase component Bud32